LKFHGFSITAVMRHGGKACKYQIDRFRH